MSSSPILYLRLPNWLGDVCMTLPVLEAFLARNYQVIVCARPWAKPLLSGYALTDFVPMTGKLKTDASALRRHKKDHGHGEAVGLSLPDSLSSALIFKWAGVPCAGYKDDGRSWLLSWPITKPTAHLHAVESWYYLAHRAAEYWQHSIAPTPIKSLHLAGVPSANPAKFGLDPTQRNVLIAPTAIGLHKGRIKVWPHFEELTQQLQAYSVNVIMCPPPNEIDQALQNAPSAMRLEPLPLLEFAQLCKSVDWVVCNDSGVSHLAAAVGSTQLTLIGVTDPAHTGPWSDQATCLGSLNHWPTVQTVLTPLIESMTLKK